MILKNLESHTNTIVRENDIDFHIINSHREIQLTELIQCDAIIFRTDRISQVQTELKKIRRSDLPSLYLKPVFVTTKRVYSKLKGELDGFVEASDIDSIEETTNEILKRLQSINPNPISSKMAYGDQVLLKTMQYIYSRDIELQAQRSRAAHMGYYYPFVDQLIPDLELHTFLDKVEIAAKKNWLKKKLQDRVNLCRSCGSSYLHFAETCHKCQSIDIDSESLIHHFRCAYIGPESDFKQEEILMCPKCDKVLRHIGVDYDKPSEIIQCNSCNHESQQSAIKATCVDCGTENELAKLYSKEVLNLSLTEEGIAKIMHAEDFSLNDEIETSVLNDYELESQVFDLVRRQEVHKMNGHKLHSYNVKISFNKSILTHLSQKEQDIFSYEFRKIIGNYLESIDLMTARDYHEYDLLLSTKTEHYIEDMRETLRYNINKIINDNFDDPAHELVIEVKRLDKSFVE